MDVDAWTAFVDSLTGSIARAAWPVVACYLAIQIDRHLRKDS
jgi:hypothetical protein